jgi:hypothetical protein
MQNITITFPDDRFTLQDVTLTVISKLSVHALKSSFTIEEDAQDIPCTITDDSTTSKMLSIRVPADVRETFALTLKRSAVRKLEHLQLLFSYTVRTSSTPLYCTVGPP